ncbi:hypothetical protein A3Q56_08763, partial [Intoshia linei]
MSNRNGNNIVGHFYGLTLNLNKLPANLQIIKRVLELKDEKFTLSFRTVSKEQDLVLLPCRHHILRSVLIEVFGTSATPDITGDAFIKKVSEAYKENSKTFYGPH